MGSGGLIVMDEDSCMVDVARFFLEFVQDEIVRQVRRPAASAPSGCWRSSTASAQGKGEEGDIERLIDLGEMIKRPRSAAWARRRRTPCSRTIRHFRHEYDEHIRDKHCRAGVCPALVNAPLLQRLPGQRRHPRLRSLVAEKRYAEALRLHRERNPFAGHLLARLLPHLRGQVPPLDARRAGLDPRHQAVHGRPGE